MFRLNFTSQVMGQEGADRLRAKSVTQTIRSPSSDIVGALINNLIAVGSAIEIALDGEVIGEVVITWCDRVSYGSVKQEDADVGGFDSIEEWEKALKRAGYRFKPLSEYNFYRVRFRW